MAFQLILILPDSVSGSHNMKKIDWYILRKFLSTFFFSVILLTVISTVIDMSEKTDDFVRSGLTSKEIFSQYYSGFIPYIIAFLFPLFVFISVIFFTSKMANQSEFIAILASGVSLRRILVPYVIGGLLLAGLLWGGNLYIVPRANEKRGAFETKYVQAPTPDVISRSLYFRLDSFSYCGIHYYDTTTRSGGSFFSETIRDYQVVYNIRADNIRWDTAKKLWKMTGVLERKVDATKEDVQYYQELFRKFPFEPRDLQRDEFVKNRLTSPELKRMIELEILRGSENVKDLQMEAAHRSATPAAVVLLTLIGAIIAIRKIRGGSGVHLAIGIFICAVFILADRFSTIFSTKGNLNPTLAAWLPIALFGGLTWWLYEKAPK
jgi:lipopolysaccharide export system permease protein